MNDISILPAASTTPFKDTHDRTFGARADLYIPLRQLWRPAEIRDDLLPWLAWALSIDIWDDSWPIEKKRAVVAEWFDLHRYKGTLAGIERHIEIAGARLRRALTPPDKFFLSPSLTRDEREAFLARFPQLRIYPYVRRAQQQYGGFFGGTPGLGLAKTFWGGGPEGGPIAPTFFLTDFHTFDRYKRVAKLYEPRDGSLTDLTYRTVKETVIGGEAVEYEQIILPPIPSSQFFPGGGPKARIFFGTPWVAQRVVSVAVQRYYEHAVGQPQYHTIAPSLDPISVRPRHVAEPGQRAKGALFPGKRGARAFLAGCYMPPSTAWQRLYDCLWLHDKARLPDERPRTSHMGHVRFGMPAYHAQLTVEIRKKRIKRAFSGFMCGYFIPYDPKPVDDVLRATRIAKAKRDKIWLRTRTVRPVQVSDARRVEDAVTIGALTPDL